MPRLLINADDFGLHPDIDRGILACVDVGRMTGVSVCANGPHVDWSTVRALAARGIDIGVHVTLVGERWLTRPWTFKKWTTLMPWLLLPGRRALLETEVHAQIEIFFEQGVKITHLDSHQHVHVMSPIWGICVALAREFSIERIRAPRAPHPSVAKHSPAGNVLEHFSQRRCRASALQQGTFPGPPCIGIAHAGHNTASIYTRELEASRALDVEVVAHPGVNTDALQSIYATWSFDWDSERNALISDGFGETVERLGYEIRSRKRTL